VFAKLRIWAKHLKRQVVILYFAYKDDRTPWYAKLFSVCVVAYAFSPIDLIPDFIPILGYLDDAILIPLGVMLALKMVPGTVIEDAKIKAAQLTGKLKNWLVGGLIILVWIAITIWIVWMIYNSLNRG